ncbi:hypothetical protein LRD18_12770, partial [Halorhodospira halochloris]|uniref:hypothetical protein n=1 Tax=Halorhodospira halochloris TaxID=1052 RepID=UPI001EE7DD16
LDALHIRCEQSSWLDVQRLIQLDKGMQSGATVTPTDFVEMLATDPGAAGRFSHRELPNARLPANDDFKLSHPNCFDNGNGHLDLVQQILTLTYVRL